MAARQLTVVTAVSFGGFGDRGAGQRQGAQGAALADLRSALQGKLSSSLDAQLLVPHPAGNAQMGAL